jgi:hypothetical protein
MKKILFAMVCAVGLLTACGPAPRQYTSQEIENKKQEELSKQAITTVGMPAVVNFAEKRMMKDIIELRDKMQPTYTYLVGTNNQLTKLCDSLGYGLPYATQYTNPQKEADYSHAVIANADPNGLYSPSNAEGTWVLCLDPKSKKAMPMYIEPRVIVSPYALN